MIFLAILSCFFDSSMPKTATKAPDDCTSQYLQSTKNSRPHDWLSQQPDNLGRIVFLAEHHGQAHQIDRLTQFLEVAAQKEAHLIFAAEWLPEKSEDMLNQMLQEPEWSTDTWWAVVEDKYYIAPLTLEDYEQPIRRIQQLNKDRSTPIRVLGLAPDCHFRTLKTAAAVKSCLSQRENTMAKRIRNNFSPRSDAFLLVSSGHRHAQLIQSDTTSSAPLAQQLSTDFSVKSILMSGIESDGHQTCSGLFSSVANDTIFSLFELPNSKLTTACLTEDPRHQTVLLSEAFTDFWVTPQPWRKGRTISLEAIGKMSKETLKSWSKFQFELLNGMDVGTNPEAWKHTLDLQYPIQEHDTSTAFDCSRLKNISQ